jgi:hypothetical protein
MDTPAELSEEDEVDPREMLLKGDHHPEEKKLKGVNDFIFLDES